MKPSRRPSFCNFFLSWFTIFYDSTRDKDDTTVGVDHSRRYCNTGYDQSQGRRQGRNQKKMLGGAQPKDGSRLASRGTNSRAKPESRARSARELRAKPEPRAMPENKRGEGSGEGARWAPPQKFFQNYNLELSNLVYSWCQNRKLRTNHISQVWRTFFIQELILYDVNTVEYKFVHTQSSCNHCVSNITWKCYPLCQHLHKFSPR